MQSSQLVLFASHFFRELVFLSAGLILVHLWIEMIENTTGCIRGLLSEMVPCRRDQ